MNALIQIRQPATRVLNAWTVDCNTTTLQIVTAVADFLGHLRYISSRVWGRSQDTDPALDLEDLDLALVFLLKVRHDAHQRVFDGARLLIIR